MATLTPASRCKLEELLVSITPHDDADDAHMIKQMVDNDENLQAALELAASRIKQYELHAEMAVAELLDVQLQLKLLQASHAAVQKHDDVIRALYKGMEGVGPAGQAHNPFNAELLQLELITLQQHLINSQEAMQQCVREQLSMHLDCYKEHHEHGKHIVRHCLALARCLIQQRQAASDEPSSKPSPEPSSSISSLGCPSISQDAAAAGGAAAGGSAPQSHSTHMMHNIDAVQQLLQSMQDHAEQQSSTIYGISKNL